MIAALPRLADNTSMGCLHLQSGKKTRKKIEPALGRGKSKDYLVVGLSFSENSVNHKDEMSFVNK